MDFNFQSISYLCFSKSQLYKVQENKTLYFIMILALSFIFTDGILLYIITLMAALLEIRVIYFKIKHDEASVLSYFSQYNICVALAPLIPDKIFHKESSKLEKIWKLKINQPGITNV
jgi:hypothetical protein